jgi:hypothetical protein
MVSALGVADVALLTLDAISMTAAALLAADDRFTGAGHPSLAARFAFSLDDDRRLEAIAELARAWPGMRPE